MTDLFAARLKELRLKKGLTQARLAAELDKAESTVRMWELGKNQPNHESLLHLAHIFAVSVDYLLGQADSWRREADGPDIAAMVAACEQRPALKSLVMLALRASDEELATVMRILDALHK